jgi:hypothetical protein
MTLEEFEAALDLYGASIANWPEAQRLAAAAVLERSAEARTMLATAKEVATLLAKTRTGPTTRPDRIVAIATAQKQQRPPAPALRLPRTGWRYAACVAIALIGFALGVADGLLQEAPLEPILTLAFGPVDPFDAL